MVDLSLPLQLELWKWAINDGLWVNPEALRALFTNLLILWLTCELCNPLDDWLESTSPTNHPAGYIIRGVTRELKI